MNKVCASFVIALELAGAALAQEAAVNPQPEQRIVLRKLKDFADSIDVRIKEFDLVAAAEAKTDKEKVDKFTCLTRISQQILGDQVTAVAYFEASKTARGEAQEEIKGVITKLDEHLLSRFEENSGLLDAVFENPQIRKALEDKDLAPAKRAEMIREEFAKTPEAAQLLTDLARQVGDLATALDQFSKYAEHIKAREKQWTEFAERVKAQRTRAKAILDENVRVFAREIETKVILDRLGKTGAFDAPPMYRNFFGDPPPGFVVKGPDLPNDGGHSTFDPNPRPVDAEALLNALLKVSELRKAKVAPPAGAKDSVGEKKTKKETK